MSLQRELNYGDLFTEKIQEEAVSFRNQQDTINNAAPYENMQFLHQESSENIADKGKSTSRKGFLNKFRRSMSMTAETANELTQNLSKPRSTFYLTEAINADVDDKGELGSGNDSGFPSSPVHRNSRTSLTRPQSPPPPIPTQNIGKSYQLSYTRCPEVIVRYLSWCPC